MEIKIDTKKDSTEDIKKAIDFLLKFVGQQRTDDTPVVSEGMFNIFGDEKKDSDDKDDSSGVSIVEY